MKLLQLQVAAFLNTTQKQLHKIRQEVIRILKSDDDALGALFMLPETYYFTLNGKPKGLCGIDKDDEGNIVLMLTSATKQAAKITHVKLQNLTDEDFFQFLNIFAQICKENKELKELCA